MKSLTREVIVEALRLLADRLQPAEVRVDLIIVGGAAMVLLFGARDSTKDVDALVRRADGARAHEVGAPPERLRLWVSDP